MKKKISAAFFVIVISIIAILLTLSPTRALIVDLFKPQPAQMPNGDYFAVFEQGYERYSSTSIAQVQSYVDRCPRRPECYAALLLGYQGHYTRLFFYHSANISASDMAQHDKIASKFLAYTDTSIKLDPTNGFFYAEKATGYLWRRQVDKAIPYIRAASNAPRWDNYTGAEYRALSRDVQLSHGYMNAIDNLAALESTGGGFDYGNYNRLSESIIRIAINAEHAGDIDKGWRLRKIVRDFGFAMMKAKGNYYYGASEGVALVNISCRAYLDSSPSHTDLWVGEGDGYASYLARHGRAAQGAQIAQDLAYNKKCSQIVNNCDDNYYVHLKFWVCQCLYESSPYETETGPNLIDRFVLEFCAAALLIYGVVFALIMGVFAQIMLLFFPNKPGARSQKMIVIGGLLLFFGITAGIATLAARHSLLLPIFQRAMRLNEMDNYYSFLSSDDNSSQSYLLNDWLGIVFAIQLVTAFIVAIIARKQQAHALPAFTKSLLRSSQVFAAIFVIAFALLAPPLLSTNAKANRRIETLSSGMLAFYMQMTHTHWPAGAPRLLLAPQ